MFLFLGSGHYWNRNRKLSWMMFIFVWVNKWDRRWNDKSFSPVPEIGYLNFVDISINNILFAETTVTLTKIHVMINYGPVSFNIWLLSSTVVCKKIHFLLPVFNFPRYLLEGTKICCQVKILISSSVFTYFKLKPISTYGEISRYNTVHMALNRHHDSESVKACLFLENRCYCKNVATCKNFRP